VGKLFTLVVIAALAGGVVAVYNAIHYDVLQPVPLTWTHRPEEIQLLELEHQRRNLLAKLASSQRMASAGGLYLPLETTAGHMEALQAELAALDARIRALRAKLRGP
jgi:hypothetical protein